VLRKSTIQQSCNIITNEMVVTEEKQSKAKATATANPLKQSIAVSNFKQLAFIISHPMQR